MRLVCVGGPVHEETYEVNARELRVPVRSDANQSLTTLIEESALPSSYAPGYRVATYEVANLATPFGSRTYLRYVGTR